MWWFLIRAAVIALIVCIVYFYVTSQFTAVKRVYSWMHPDPMMVP